MKKAAVLLILIFSCFTCYTDPRRDNPSDPYTWYIEYPDTGHFGENLLGGKEISINTSLKYSLYAAIKGEKNIRVKINNTASWTWTDSPERVIGWTILNLPIDGVRVFGASGPGSYECEIGFAPSPGSIEIQVFEDWSLSPVRTVTLNW